MDDRLAAAPVVTRYAQQIGGAVDLTALYVGGSLAFGDYRPGVSDLDVITVIARGLDRAARAKVTALHEGLIAADPIAAKLHCAYVTAPDAADLAREHLYWGHGELYGRAVSGIARAEVLQNGIVVHGPPPHSLLPELDAAEIRAAALAELSGYWTGAVAKSRLWRDDVYVDLGLITLARVEATVTEDRLITKREAIERLDRFGVPAGLAGEIARRRAGETVELSGEDRRARAELARTLMRSGIERLLGPR
ncbi:hypothetical protein AB0I28_36295 [Phytomonospora sp. NPDC050363]|uniref:hypothetical protein n=1 Tax=Phytomonospora sp. NPDC050363 TaxID=3155642 RepID=UPI0033CB7A1E